MLSTMAISTARSFGRGAGGRNFETGETITVTNDEVPRDTSLEAAELKPVAREDGVHTAGTFATPTVLPLYLG